MLEDSTTEMGGKFPEYAVMDRRRIMNRERIIMCKYFLTILIELMNRNKEKIINSLITFMIQWQTRKMDSSQEQV